jgi:pimeloyl-ACP methyl ester carboxylesterase
VKVLGATVWSHPESESKPSVLLPAEIQLPTDHWRGSLRRDYAYRDAIKSYLADEEAAIASKGLVRRPDNRSIAMFHDGAATKGVAILLHGLDDGPTQWNAMMQSIYDLGYDVFVPNLPGHGLLNPDGTANLSFMPTAENFKDWTRFEDRLFDLARSSGRVSVVGLSAGGLLTLQLAERHAGDLDANGEPILQNVVVISPLLNLAGNFKLDGTELKYGPFRITNERAAELLSTAEALVGAPVDNYLTRTLQDLKGPNPPTAYGTRYVNQDVVLGLIINADAMKANRAKLEGIPGGVKIVLSEADTVVDPKTDLGFAKSIGAKTFVFPLTEKVPHAMINPLENPNQASVDAVRGEILSSLSR